jgi:phospholipase C
MTEAWTSAKLSRRSLLKAGGGAALALGLGGSLPAALARHRWLRAPNSLPDPTRPAGEPTAALPFDHIVVLMMENHSFDCYFGMLSRRGQPKADGFAFGGDGKPANRNPYKDGYVVPFRATSECQASVTQNWNSTHKQIDGGRMDGFAKTAPQAMVYWTDEDLPFYYSLAREFTLANRWFCSAPCQTYPNRRFLLAGTAYGLISTDINSVFDPPPANGTIVDRLNAHNISWRDYFTDVPATGVIGSIVQNNPANMASIETFFSDCAAGNLPDVSFVDPEIGLAGEVGSGLSQLPIPPLQGLGDTVGAQGGSEENPQNIQIGQFFCDQVINAVLNSPAWPRTLLVWTYDEHGGYYDHVPPPRAVKPDSIPPKLKSTDIQGGYDLYGPRVPTVVVSPYSKPGTVNNAVYDHTSILATIEAKWNLPACTYRDANARTVAGFLDSKPALLEPPQLAAAQNPTGSEQSCSTADPPLEVQKKWHA